MDDADRRRRCGVNCSRQMFTPEFGDRRPWMVQRAINGSA